MPRGSRKTSPFNYYHIIARGNNKQDIFFDEMDRKKFMKELIKVKEKYSYSLYAYVLMPNHIHLCIKDNKQALSKIMHSLLVSYAEYFNKKYERIGYLFQDRFLSEPIENEIYLKNVIRYIHFNPEKAGIQKYNQYRWSSYLKYLSMKEENVDKDEILKMFSENSNKILQFKKFHEEKMSKETAKDLVRYEIKSRLEDEELYDILLSVYSKEEIQNLCRLNKRNLIPYLKYILKVEGTNNTQISRVTGINLQMIKYIKRELKGNKK